MKTRYFGIYWALVLLMLIALVIAYPHLPDRVPTHWNGQNRVNGYSSRGSLFLWGPGLMTGIMLLFAALPWLSPKRFEVDTFKSTYLYIMVLAVGFLAYTNALILWSALSGPINMVRACLGGVSVLMALMGNVMGKVRRNFWVGIRTPWTLASERVWNATHRFAAKAMVLVGAAALVVALSGALFWVWFAMVLVGGLLSPVLYSLICYKRLERRGQLET
jgi:uncharacterized membrane protein